MSHWRITVNLPLPSCTFSGALGRSTHIRHTRGVIAAKTREHYNSVSHTEGSGAEGRVERGGGVARRASPAVGVSRASADAQNSGGLSGAAGALRRRSTEKLLRGRAETVLRDNAAARGNVAAAVYARHERRHAWNILINSCRRRRRAEKRLLSCFFSRTPVSRQLLFQCGIQFCCSRQAEILQDQDLPHGSLTPRAAALRHAVPPGALQAGRPPGPRLLAHRRRRRPHRPPQRNPAAAAAHHHHRRAQGRHARADRDAEPAQLGGGGPERSALLRLGEPLPARAAVVPQPDAVRPPRPADGGEDPRLLHLRQGPQAHPPDEPGHQAAAHPPRPHRARSLGLHAGLLQPSAEAQALPAHRVGAGEGRRDQPGIQSAQPQPLLRAHAELAAVLPPGEHPRGGRGPAHPGPLPRDEKGGEVPEAGAADQRLQFLLQQDQGILLFEGPRARALFTRLQGQGAPPRGPRHPAETLPVLSRTQQEVL